MVFSALNPSPRWLSGSAWTIDEYKSASCLFLVLFWQPVDRVDFPDQRERSTNIKVRVVVFFLSFFGEWRNGEITSALSEGVNGRFTQPRWDLNFDEFAESLAFSWLLSLKLFFVLFWWPKMAKLALSEDPNLRSVDFPDQRERSIELSFSCLFLATRQPCWLSGSAWSPLSRTCSFSFFINVRSSDRQMSDDVGSWSPMPQSSPLLTKKGLISLTWGHWIQLWHFFSWNKAFKGHKKTQKVATALLKGQLLFFWGGNKYEDVIDVMKKQNDDPLLRRCTNSTTFQALLTKSTKKGGPS